MITKHVNLLLNMVIITYLHLSFKVYTIIGPRLKTEGSYKIASVRPCVRPSVRPFRIISETAPTIFLKLGMK